MARPVACDVVCRIQARRGRRKALGRVVERRRLGHLGQTPMTEARTGNRRQLMIQLASVRCRLAGYGIRDTGDFAEALVAEALGGKRNSSKVNNGWDVVAPRYGRVEVKSRVLPSDGRQEERVEFPRAKALGCDVVAIVIFRTDYRVKGALLIPFRRLWPVIKAHPYRRIGFTAAARLRGAVDITEEVARASEH